ncbi:hypothetical protein [Streptomyces sp. TS71-3]|uniref:hypothetical protein n=1 Tax=Streptomyces sp. TS71-3 TaxID=2733862 RepID=UPI001B221626|nr:hypothetical protein [Streptomyces sp. TS71-3]GHJ40904.1 hypothetical protein Sm713_65130 [Streptomyces sp. TS71-3]
MSDPRPSDRQIAAEHRRGAAPTATGAGGRSRLSLLALAAPSVSAAVAALFLLVGGLSSLRGHSYLGAGVMTVGKLAGAIAAGALVGDLGWQLAEARKRQTRREPAAPGGA